MIFSLAIYSAPHTSQANDSAYRFACAAIASGHQLHRVFFYQDGVHSASSFAAPPQDEPHLPDKWQALANRYQIDMVVCVAAALRRGILNQEEAVRYRKQGHNLLSGFELGGLGQLLEAALTSDRLITFGN